MHLYSARDRPAALAALAELVGPEVLPPDYGGTSPAQTLYDGEMEQRFWAHMRGVGGGADAAAPPAAAGGEEGEEEATETAAVEEDEEEWEIQ